MVPSIEKVCVFLLAAMSLEIGIAPLLAQDAISLVGSGSSVPSPLYTAWTEQYEKMKQNVRVSYLQLGTSESIKEISQGVGDFGGGEIPLSECRANVFNDVGGGKGREQEQNCKRGRTHYSMMQRSRKRFQSGSVFMVEEGGTTFLPAHSPHLRSSAVG